MEAGKGGVALGIHKDLKNCITKEGTSNCRRVVWACIHHAGWGRVGFVRVYGPNDIQGRIALWAELNSALDDSYHWILVGDFNMVTNAFNQKGGIGSILGGREAGVRATLLRKLNVQDTFTRPGEGIPLFQLG